MMKKKILIVSNMYPSKKYPHYGIFVQHSAEILNDAGYQVSVVALKKTKLKIKKIFSYIFFYSKVIFKTSFYNYDVVYAHYASHTAVPLLIAKKIKKKVKLVVNVHGNDVIAETTHDKKFERLVQKLLNRAALIICPSLYFKKAVMTNFSIENEKIIIYPSGGVDTYFFRKIEKKVALEHLNLSSKFKYIGYVSRIERDKGWDIFLNAANEIVKEYIDYKLIVVGDGTQEKQFEELVNELGIKKSIIKYELLSQKELFFIYNALDFFVFPTYRKSESLGLVGLEAMSCETLTILPDQYGPSSYADDKVNSIVFSSGDGISLKKAMKNAIEYNSDTIKKNGRKTAIAYNRIHTDHILIDAFATLIKKES